MCIGVDELQWWWRELVLAVFLPWQPLCWDVDGGGGGDGARHPPSVTMLLLGLLATLE